jgi:PPOX class probable F420-dependent enzyme
MPPLDRLLSALDQANVLSLATVRPDGRPHVVPLWFLWDGEAIVVFSKARAQKVRNLCIDPRAMVAIGEPGIGEVALLEASAEIHEAATFHATPVFARKYEERLAQLGLTKDAFFETYSVQIRLRPTRWLEWGAHLPGGVGGVSRTVPSTHPGRPAEART